MGPGGVRPRSGGSCVRPVMIRCAKAHVRHRCHLLHAHAPPPSSPHLKRRISYWPCRLAPGVGAAASRCAASGDRPCGPKPG